MTSWTHAGPIERVLAVSNVYPSPDHPESGAFAEALFCKVAEAGPEVRVVAPKSRSRAIWSTLFRRKQIDGYRESGLNVRRPAYWSVSTRLFPWGGLAGRLSWASFERALERDLRGAIGGYDLVHAYFYGTGRACLRLCESAGVGCIVEIGESSLATYDALWGPDDFAANLGRFGGVIAVSEQNEQFCRMRRPDLGDRLIYLPNGVDTDRFRPLERGWAREQLGLPQDEPIVVFVGHFIERKGPLRVLAALEHLRGVQGLFVGRGPQVPVGKRVLRAEVVSASRMPLWLSAADVFVLPSLAEGMSVAIIEALACGLPVVVSDRPFNRGFLDENCAVFVDPEDPTAIARGISDVLSDASRRTRMSSAAVERAQRHSLSQRAVDVLAFASRVVSEVG